MEAMRPPGLKFLTLGLLALLASRALAQAPGRILPRPETFSYGGEEGLLLSTDVQTRLNLTRDQAQQCEGLVGECKAQIREAYNSLQNIPVEQRERRWGELTAELNRQTGRRIFEILNRPDQKERFLEILLQQRPVDAFGRPDVQQALGIDRDPSLQTKIQDILRTWNERRLALLQSSRRDPEGTRRSLDEEHNRAMLAIQNLLSPNQRGWWTGMLGEPFHFDPANRRQSS
jgi:hypothetical protein